ncbi:MAG: carbonic anhydrase [Candidatus Sericytochromatia bacterium]
MKFFYVIQQWCLLALVFFLFSASGSPVSESVYKPNVEDILAYMLYHNQKFMEKHRPEDFSRQITQNPFITFLGCSDARVQADSFIPNPTNTVFTIKNIGNQLQTVQGSADYGVFHLKTPLLLVMGHTYCGAIKSALSNYTHESHEIIEELDHLHLPLSPLIYRYQRKDLFAELWIEGVQRNVDYQVSKAQYRYQDLIRNGKLTIIGAVYDFANHSQKGQGRLLVTNINGIKDLQEIKNHPALKKVSEGIKQLSVHRYPEIE